MALDANFQNWFDLNYREDFAQSMIHIQEIATDWGDWQVQLEGEAWEQKVNELNDQIKNKDALIAELRLELGKRHQEIKAMTYQLDQGKSDLLKIQRQENTLIHALVALHGYRTSMILGHHIDGQKAISFGEEIEKEITEVLGKNA